MKQYMKSMLEEKNHFVCAPGLYLLFKLSLLSSVRPLFFPLSRHLLMQTYRQKELLLYFKMTGKHNTNIKHLLIRRFSLLSALCYPERTSLLQSKKSTNLTSALVSMTFFQPWRLSSLRGKPSMRKLNFFSSFCMVSSIAWQHTR